ncbi:MAG: glutaredoxin family protein [Thermoleophilaceae bacterium]
MYTTATCGYCHAAKAVLRREHLPFEEIDLTMDERGRAALARRRASRRSWSTDARSAASRSSCRRSTQEASMPRSCEPPDEPSGARIGSHRHDPDP